MNDRETFKNNLNYYLSSSGKLQKDLADYVGAKTTTVSGWTRGISYPRADSMEKIALFFGIPTSELIGNRSDHSRILSDDETRLLSAYRLASDEIRSAALAMLEDSAARRIKTPVLKTSAV